MKALEEKILKDGKVLPGGVLKVDGFLNHRIDVKFLNEIGKEFARIFSKDKVDKIVTAEASGIAVATVTAQYFGNCPVVFAKKSKTSNISNDFYTAKAHSFTHGNVSDFIISKEYLTPGENVLIIDDFLAKGSALEALLDICRQSKVHLVGCGIVVEKVFQNGGNNIRERGIRVESLARIEAMSEDGLTFL